MDDKRRIAIPTKCRKKTGTAVVLTRNLDGCLDVYPSKVWESGDTKVQRLAKRLSISKKHRKLTRFLTTAERIDLDSSGRIVIPGHLADLTDLTGSVVFVGTEEGFQLWSEELWSRDGMPSVEEAQALAESEEFQRLSDVS